MRSDSCALQERGIAGIGHKNKLTVSAKVHTLCIVQKKQSFIRSSASRTGGDVTVNEADTACLLDDMARHIEIGVHLIVLRMTGNFVAVQEIGADVRLVKGGIVAQMASTRFGNTNCGQIDPIATGSTDKEIV